MGHYAKIDSNNIVTEVIVAKADFINSLADKDSYIKTSYNTNNGKHYVPKENQDFSEESTDQSKALRARYAGIGMVYDATNDIFYDPADQYFPSWTLNTTTAMFDPPMPKPALTEEQRAKVDNKEKLVMYEWDEALYQSDNTKGWVYKEYDYPE